MKTCPVCDTDYPDQHTNCDTDGAVLIVSQELAPGSLVRGKYRIIRKLGQGGMGVVYLAEDSLLGVKVALKFLAGDLGKDPRFIKRFRTEARAAYQLRHPNIAEVTNLDQAEDGSLFIAMEYIEGPSLRAVLDQNPNGLAVPRALEIAKGIASGLAAAHAQGTIHRDIKPENILLTRAADGTERAKVLDFGIAAVAESVTKMTRTQGFILTYAYAAPEQWNEMPADQMDGRTDHYALGCVLYEMLTGTTPFHAHTTAAWMKQHCEESPKPPSTLRPELAEWTNLDALLAILLAKDRIRRPKDAAELMTLIGAVKHLKVSTFIDHPPVPGKTERNTLSQPAQPSPKPAKELPQRQAEFSHRRDKKFALWAWVSLTALAIIGSYAAWLIYQSHSPAQQQIATVPPTSTAPPGGNGNSNSTPPERSPTPGPQPPKSKQTPTVTRTIGGDGKPAAPIVRVTPTPQPPIDSTPPNLVSKPLTPPALMHVCLHHCGIWTLDSGSPLDKPHYGSQADGSIVIVDRFTRDSVVMYRTDTRPYPGKATLRGRLSPDGSSIVNGTIEWTWHPCCGTGTDPIPWRAAWGPAINTVPDSGDP